MSYGITEEKIQAVKALAEKNGFKEHACRNDIRMFIKDSHSLFLCPAYEDGQCKKGGKCFREEHGRTYYKPMPKTSRPEISSQPSVIA